MPDVLWDKLRSPTKYVSRKLGIEHVELRAAIHTIKARSNLGATDRIKIFDDGKVTDARLGISTMRSEERTRSKAFATFRVSGDDLIPDQITKVLKFYPTLSYRKGGQYLAGQRSEKLVGKTGVWFLSTEDIVASDRLSDHLSFILVVLGISSPLSQRRSGTTDSTSVSDITLRLKSIMDLRQLMKQRVLKATVTCFWHGVAGAKPPSIPVTQLLQTFSIDVESDFDADDGPKDEEGTPLVA